MIPGTSVMMALIGGNETGIDADLDFGIKLQLILIIKKCVFFYKKKGGGSNWWQRGVGLPDST